jgi:predicted molibdopterin-dependent oxidoreductase YjgC
MCDYGRLNFDYLQGERRLLEPLVREQRELQPMHLETRDRKRGRRNSSQYGGRRLPSSLPVE